MKCLVCNKESEKIICNYCLNNTDIRNIIDKIKKQEYFNDFDSIILDLSTDLESPLKEYLLIMGRIKKFYSVPKVNREYLINNASVCLGNDLINFYDKRIIKALLLDAYYKNFNFENAEGLANELKDEQVDELILYVLGDYYICTRRYEMASELLNRANDICKNEETKVSIANKLIDCEQRKLGKENGGKMPYLPTNIENKMSYIEFMKSIGIDVELPKVRSRAPEKISPDDYPIPIALKRAGFKTFVAFDIETTGINHNKDSITELAAIRVVDGKIIETKEFIFQELVHPYKRKIPANVEKITGITNEMVYDAREVWDVFKDFVAFIKDDILLGYNCMTFDSKFLVRAGRLSNIKINNSYFDVMNYVKKFKSRLNYQSKTLTDIGELLGIINPNAHRALADAITTAKVYLKLLEIDDDYVG